jgi:hypothetical protein
MEENNRVFFPLRSNVGSFQSLDLQEDIASNIKQSILVYDEIYIEDGTLTAFVTDRSNLVLYLPPGELPSDQRTIELERDLKPSSIRLEVKSPEGEWHNVISGNSIDKFKVDYYKLFEGIELCDYDFLKFDVLNIPKELNNAIDEQVQKDKILLKDMPLPAFLRDLIISNLDHDIIVSMWLQSAVTLDSKHYELIERKCTANPNFKLNNSPVTSAIREFLRFPAPDFSKMTMHDVLELREEKGWRELRNAATQSISTIHDDPELFNDPIALEKAIHYHVKSTILDESGKLRPGDQETVIDLVLAAASLIPGVGLIPTMVSAGKTIYKRLDGIDNWTGFLLKLKKFH